MYQKKLDPDRRSPVEYFSEVFSGKWDLRIYCNIAHLGPIRYGELKSELDGITDAALSLSLKKLQNNGIIGRYSYDEIPPRVEYQLTELGKSGLPIFYSICQWTSSYLGEGKEFNFRYCHNCQYNKKERSEKTSYSED